MLKAFLVSYDLINDKDYDKLITAIKSMNGHFDLLESTWLVVSKKGLDTADKIYEYLKDFIDKDDKLFVCQLITPSSSDTAQGNVGCWDWLKNFN